MIYQYVIIKNNMLSNISIVHKKIIGVDYI